MSDSLQPYDTDHRIIQARILECLPFPSLGDLPNSRIEPRSPALQADSFPTELQGKPNIYPSTREQTVSYTDSVTRRLIEDTG